MSLVFRRYIRSDDRDSVSGIYIESDERYVLEGLWRSAAGVLLHSDSQQTYTLPSADYARSYSVGVGSAYIEDELGTTEGYDVAEPTGTLILSWTLTDGQVSDMWVFFERVAEGEIFYLDDYDGITRTVQLAPGRGGPVRRRGPGGVNRITVRLLVLAEK